MFVRGLQTSGSISIGVVSKKPVVHRYGQIRRQHEVLFSPVPEERSEKTYLDTARGGDNLARGVGIKIY